MAPFEILLAPGVTGRVHEHMLNASSYPQEYLRNHMFAGQM